MKKLHWTKYCQQGGGGDPSPLPSSGRATPEALSPVLGPSVPGRRGYTGENPVRGHKYI